MQFPEVYTPQVVSIDQLDSNCKILYLKENFSEEDDQFIYCKAYEIFAIVDDRFVQIKIPDSLLHFKQLGNVICIEDDSFSYNSCASLSRLPIFALTDLDPNHFNMHDAPKLLVASLGFVYFNDLSYFNCCII